jgi:carbonic anhydrase
MKKCFVLLLTFITTISGNESEITPPSTTHSNTTNATTHQSSQIQSLNPNQVFELLLKGNNRFVAGASEYPHHDKATRIKNARDGQKPIVTILSCSDSRVPLEAIFDMGIGDLFVVRVAGNIADRSQIGSIEYGAGHLGTRLIIVLGHTKCGAVTAVVKNDHVGGNILNLINNIKPAVDFTKSNFKKLTGDTLIYQSIKMNVFQSIQDILENSYEISKLVKEGRVKIIGALYDIETGKVTNLGVHYRQMQLLRTEP